MDYMSSSTSVLIIDSRTLKLDIIVVYEIDTETVSYNENPRQCKY